MTANVDIKRGDLHLAVSTAFNRGRYVLMTGGDGQPQEITLDLRERDDDLFEGEAQDWVAESSPGRLNAAPRRRFKLSELDEAMAHPDRFHVTDDHGPAIPAQSVRQNPQPPFGPIVYEFGIHEVRRWQGVERDYALAQTTIHDAADLEAAESADWVHVYDRVTRERRTLKRPAADAVLTGLRDVAADLRRGPGTPKPYVGQQITVTDYHGVKGPGVVTQASADGFKVDVQFRHTDSSPDTADRYEWFFTHGETNDYGLTLDFVPFTPEPVRGAPVEPPFGCAALPPVGPLTSTEGLREGDIVRVSYGWGWDGIGPVSSVDDINGVPTIGVVVPGRGDGGFDLQHLAFVGRPDADGWMTWAGGENPAGTAPVEWFNRDGASGRCLASELAGWGWPYLGGGGDVVRFRIVDTPPAV